VGADLVERAKRGDREAFGLLAAERVDRLGAIARLVARDPDLAQDAVQEALVRCWRDLPSLRDVERLDGWLYRLLMRAIADEFRRRRRFEAVIESITATRWVDHGSVELADREQIERGFRRLSLEQRAVVVLHHYVGLSLPEVATALAIPAGTAKSRHRSALAALRAALDADARVGRHGEVPA
jgi:RNA polymerase sigma-70 factor (ECF subfamily)